MTTTATSATFDVALACGPSNLTTWHHHTAVLLPLPIYAQRALFLGKGALHHGVHYGCYAIQVKKKYGEEEIPKREAAMSWPTMVNSRHLSKMKNKQKRSYYVVPSYVITKHVALAMLL